MKGADIMDTESIIARYQSFKSAEISVATVSDYCDSMDNLQHFASIAGDLKDVQRPWMIKAILGTVPIGGKLLEIGAGEPFVADFLSRCGYEVTIIDPYDGSGQGPTEFEAFRSRFKHIKFIRGHFCENTPSLQKSTYDAIYSISVLEHISTEIVPSVCHGINRYCGPGGVSLHAIDHVLKGAGDREHLEKLQVYAEHLGLKSSHLAALLHECAADPETYLLSAEGHNRWRGGLDYQSFPMRRVVSVQFVTQVI